MAEFSYQNYELRLLGHSPVTLKGNKWTYKDPKMTVKGRGNVSLGFVSNGGSEGEGTLKILQSDYVAIVTAIKTANPVNKITDVTFDLVETYSQGARAVTNILQTVTIEEFNGGLDSGDPYLTLELKYKFLDVLENV